MYDTDDGSVGDLIIRTLEFGVAEKYGARSFKCYISFANFYFRTLYIKFLYTQSNSSMLVKNSWAPKNEAPYFHLNIEPSFELSNLPKIV